MKSVQLINTRKLWKWTRTTTLKREMPTEWNELSPKQIEKLIKLIHGPGSMHLIMHYCIKVLLRLSWPKFFLFLPELKSLWLDEHGEPKTFIRLNTLFLFEGFTLTVNPFPVLRIGKAIFYGPRDYCEGLTTLEFIAVETYLQTFHQSKEIKDLDFFIAAIYRPQGSGDEQDPTSENFSGDRREPFNDHRVESRLQLIKKIPEARKLSVLYFYRSCRHLWETSFDLVFTGKSNENNYGWFEMIKSANEKDWGTIEKKEKVPIANMLMSMQIDIRNHNELKRNNEV